MNIQAEKIELIRLIADINNKEILKKIKVLLTSTKSEEMSDNLPNPVMAKRLKESREQIKEGKGVKVTLDDIWK